MPKDSIVRSTVLVGSDNPVKIAAVREAFSTLSKKARIVSRPVDPGVSRQPFNDEVFEGAYNRALALKKELSGAADLSLGIEGGVVEGFSRYFAAGAACVMDKNGNTAYGTSPFFELPPRVVKVLKRGRELSAVVKDLEKGTPRGGKGAIGYFTRGAFVRKDLYVPAIICAMVPFLNKNMYFDGKEANSVPIREDRFFAAIARKLRR